MVYLDPLGVGVQAEETICVARQVTHLLVRIKFFKQSGLSQYFRTGVARVSTNENAGCDSSIAFQNKP